MNNQEIEYIKSCGSILQQSCDHSEIIATLEQLQSVNICIATLKSTRIGAIVNKLTKRDLPSNIQKFAWKLVNDWKEIANLSMRREEQQQPHTAPPSHNPSPIPTRTRKRPCTDTNSNNSLNPHKRHRSDTTHSHSHSMFAMPHSNNKTVPSLQQICLKVMQKNAIHIGKVPCELNAEYVQQIYGSLKPSELKRIYKINPHLRKHLDILWRRQVMELNPNYVKRDSTMSWFKAYQLYLLERKDKLAQAKHRLAIKAEDAKYNKQSTTRLLSKEEAVIIKERQRRKKNSMRRQSAQQTKKSKMMKSCMDYVNQRKRMFKVGAIKNNRRNTNTNTNNRNKKQSFIKRQRELREKRKADKNALCQW